MTAVGRGFASWQVLVVLAVFASILLLVQRKMAASDVALATGAPSRAQAQFFEDASERPDLDLFFKALKPSQRLRMAQNLGDHANAASAKAIVRLLATFDEDARRALTDSLIKIAQRDPGLVAPHLGAAGSFERAGVSQALASAGQEGQRAAASGLSKPDLRPHAIRFLAEGGREAIAIVLPMLEDPDSETRAAAAEALGKLRALEAVEPLLEKLKKASGKEREALLSSLSDIGDSRAEAVLLAEVPADTAKPPIRLLGGLGRMASHASIRRLESIYERGSDETKEAAMEALVLGQDAALRRIADPKLALDVASQIRSAEADAVIRRALANPRLAETAIRAAAGRPELAADLWPQGIRPEDRTVAIRMKAMATTPPGKAILNKLAIAPEFSGFARRALALSEP